MIPSPVTRPRWPRLVIAALLTLSAVSLVMIFTTTYQRALTALIHESRTTAQLQLAVLQSELDKQRSAPVILADDSDVIRTLTDANPAHALAISQKLERLQRETKSAVIYLIDARGVTVSASNWALPTSFVGSNYSFRDYFKDALRDGEAEQFALGTVSRHPGLYLAHRVMARDKTGDHPAGIVVVKVEFDAMETAWARAGNMTFVTGANKAILLTSHPAIRFHPGPAPSTSQVLTTLPAPVSGWQLHLLSSRRAVEAMAIGATFTAGLAELLAIVAIVWLWRRQQAVSDRAAAENQYRDKLERNVISRTQELSDTNTRLSAEIRDRQQAEQRLNILQADLVQANKLASLGQITAGVAHEINQPLATIRILAENALTVIARKAKGTPGLIGENLGNIVRMSERIGHITGELRAFSRKAQGETEPVLLKETIDSSILLNQSRLRDNHVRLIRTPIPPKLKVVAGRIRLEQVLVNLLQNAFEALEGRPGAEVRLAVREDDARVYLDVADNGPGLKPEVMAQLFTPFVTTKPKGLGLGLVIAHDILRDFGGELTAASSDAGATFTLSLRKAAP